MKSLTLLVSMCTLALGAASPAEASGAVQAAVAPNFRTTDLGGNRVSLDGLLGRGPILVDFWATWCKPCLKELPHVQRMYDEYGDEGLQVLAVTIDSPKSQSRVKPFIRGKKYTFPVLMDPDQNVLRKLQGKGTVPYVVILDEEGRIRYQHTGYRPGDEKEIDRVVRGLLGLDEVAEASGETPSAHEVTAESTD